MLLRILATLTILSAPAASQCIVHRALDTQSDNFFGLNLALSGEWLAVEDDDNDSSTYGVQLHREGPDGRWSLAQTLTVPGSLGTRNAFALDGDRLFLSTAGSLQAYELQGALWQPVGAPTPNGWDVVRLAYDHPYLVASNPSVFDPLSFTVAGRARVYRVDDAGGLTSIQVLSGSTAVGDAFGSAVDVRATASGNGTIAIGAPANEIFPLAPGTVRIYAVDASGVSLQDVVSNPSGAGLPDQFGRAVAVTPQLLAVQSRVDGRVELFRRNPLGVWAPDGTLTPAAGQLEFGARLALDGVNLALTALDTASGSTRVLLYERVQGAWTFRAAFDEPEQADTNGGLDLDLPRLASAAVAFPGGPSGTGAAWIWDVDGEDCPGLVTSPASASLAAGAEIGLISSFAPQAAGEIYVVLASATGTSPGVALGGLTVPLVPDAWTDAALLLANQPPFQAAFGVLDDLGGASSKLILPAGASGALAGLTVYHATLTLDGQTAAPVRVSAPSELALLP